MNSALQPQLLKLEEVFDETVNSGTTIQAEVKSAILLRCVGGQLKSYLNLTIGDNVQYSTLRERVLQWDRSQQWATLLVARAKVKAQTNSGKGVATCYTCGKPGHLSKDCWRNNIPQVASDQAHSFSGGASMTTHTVSYSWSTTCQCEPAG